jgi:hypothetical protein
MATIRTAIYPDGTKHHLYNCPGCKWEHAFSPNVHQFDGNMDRPTISPSLLHNSSHVCHSYIKDGVIEFLGDCWHELKGQKVPLPHYPADQVLLIDHSK